MLRRSKLVVLGLLKRAGVFEIVANSRWRQQRLLILCYHGISQSDEHQWRPALYIPYPVLQKRLQILQQTRCEILPLSEALMRLRAGTLPPRSVALTFDDGTYDFYKLAYPLLNRYGFPATVYQTTYYAEHDLPVFNLICSYLLWKRRGEQLNALRELGLSEPMDLRTEAGRHRVVRGLIDFSDRQNLTGWQKNDLAARLAGFLRIDYACLCSQRILQLMNAKELAEVSRNGIDVQLHTHRHRTPTDEDEFRREIRENRERLQLLTGREARHFCYPSGVYREEFFGWLQKEDILSATTCDAGLALRNHPPYRLPRLVDTSARTDLEFESWLGGVGSLIAMRKAARQRYIPHD
jgi:peptidoglycan/xylan/chitin deacetylase (PgdA/CDA1 family)